MSRREGRMSQVLRIAGLFVAVPACVYALSVGAPAALAQNAANSLAAASVSISAGVVPNFDNTLASELTQKQQNLNTQEQALKQKEAALSLQGAASSSSLGLYSFVASIVLFLLIGLNFYYDRRRTRFPSVMQRALTVDLRVQR